MQTLLDAIMVVVRRKGTSFHVTLHSYVILPCSCSHDSCTVYDNMDW